MSDAAARAACPQPRAWLEGSDGVPAYDRSVTEEPADLTLELTRVLPAPPEAVFAAFSEPEELAQWWGPEGFTIPSVDFRPRVGASYRIEMRPPEDESFYLKGAFRAVDPPTHLAYSFVWEPPDPDDVETIVDLRFREAGESTDDSSPRARSRPRSVAHFTATAGARPSTSLSAISARAGGRESRPLSR